MNIVIFGAGAIGSLFGAILSKKNNVLLVGRKDHVSKIKKSGLVIDGKTRLNVKIDAKHSVNDIDFSPDLLILTVKSYDTESAIIQACEIINKNTAVLSIQNGLDNIDKLKNFAGSNRIIAGVTTHGALFSKPGVVTHTGEGSTILGELSGRKTKRIEEITNIFNSAGIASTISNNILREIWIKTIVNSCVNPLTTFFQCKNGYLLENPILEKLVEKICLESTNIAQAERIDISYDEMIKKTKIVIKNTAENQSSMLQSFKKGKITEIDSINGKLIEIAKKHKTVSTMNDILLNSVDFLTNK
jgi:2-dehydropantoate 2-reductase